MAKLVGGLAALMALASGILSQVDSILCLQRALLAYTIGWFGTQFWYVFFTVRIQSLNSSRSRKEKAPELVEEQVAA